MVKSRQRSQEVKNLIQVLSNFPNQTDLFLHLWITSFLGKGEEHNLTRMGKIIIQWWEYNTSSTSLGITSTLGRVSLFLVAWILAWTEPHSPKPFQDYLGRWDFDCPMPGSARSDGAEWWRLAWFPEEGTSLPSNWCPGQVQETLAEPVQPASWARFGPYCFPVCSFLWQKWKHSAWQVSSVG